MRSSEAELAGAECSPCISRQNSVGILVDFSAFFTITSPPLASTEGSLDCVCEHARWVDAVVLNLESQDKWYVVRIMVLYPILRFFLL